MRVEKLENISEVFSGLVLNRFSTQDNGKKYKYVTLKSVEDNNVEQSSFDTVKVERKIEPRYLLKKGDILFKLSPPYSTVEISFEPEDVIIPSNFAVIRVKDKEVEPRYLSFLMSSKDFKNNLKKQSEGSSLAVMKIQTIKDLEFRIINIDKQKEYCEFINLLIKKEKLRKKVAELEEIFKDYVLNKI